MKIAVLSESAADEAAIHVLCSSIVSTNQVDTFPLRSRGWPAVKIVLPAVIKHLYYQTDADGLVLVVDSNHSPVHLNGEHDRSLCRLCLLREDASKVIGHLRPLSTRTRLKVAIGVAMPSIEAWYLCGVDPQVTEAAWSMGLSNGKDPYTKFQLKMKVYGTEIPTLELETTEAIRQANRLALDLTQLEMFFPGGFGNLVSELKGF